MSRYIDLLLHWSRQPSSFARKIISGAGGLVVFLVVIPGALIIFGRWVFVSFEPLLPRWSEWALAILAGVPGLALVTWATATQWRIGRGTPAYTAPTQHLVVAGPYRHCRNPIQLGANLYHFAICTVMAGSVTGFFALALGLTIGSSYHKFVEEKELDARFGEEYRNYRNQTPFLFLRPWRIIRQRQEGADNDRK